MYRIPEKQFRTFPSTNTSTSYRPYINPTSTVNRRHIDATSTLHRPHIDPTSTLHRPYIDPTSIPYRPYIDPTSTLDSPFLNTVWSIVNIYNNHHIFPSSIFLFPPLQFYYFSSSMFYSLLYIFISNLKFRWTVTWRTLTLAAAAWVDLARETNFKFQ